MQHNAPWIAGQRVIVTGAGGFIGRLVMQALAKAGATPVGLVRGPHPAQQDAGFQWAHADLVSDPLDPLLTDLRPDAVIHCAGLTLAPDNDEGRTDLFTANLTATERLIRALSQVPKPVRTVIVSSAAIYAPMPPGLALIDEQHPLQPVAAYGVSKAAATRHALAEGERLDLDLSVAVPFNVIGPGQLNHLVPQVFIEQLRANAATFTLSNPTVVRDWVDARDVAAALLALCQPNGPRGMFNVASGKGRSLQDMLTALCRVGGWQPTVVKGAPHNASGVSKCIGNPEKMFAATGWRPRIALDDSLRDMIFPSDS